MTTLEAPTSLGPSRPAEGPAGPSPAGSSRSRPASPPPGPRRRRASAGFPRGAARRLATTARSGVAAVTDPRRRGRVLAVVWVVVALACFALVLYVVEPMFQQSTQAGLLSRYTQEIDRASNSGSGLPGAAAAAKAPEMGDPVAIIEIGVLKLRQVVVEGVSSEQTQAGPGHVPGTAAPGQPGNSAIVARRSMFGGPFADLGRLANGDSIVVTTTQGMSVYEVSEVAHTTIAEPDASAGSASTGAVASDTDSTTIDELYGKTKEDRLTLVTSGSGLPTNSADAVVVTATMVEQPYQPTLQNGRSESQTGTNGDAGGWAPLLISLQLLVLAVLAAVWLYRRSTMRTAYLLTVPPMLVLTILTAEAASRLLPAWT